MQVKPGTLKFAVASLFCAAPFFSSAPLQAESSDGYLTDSAGRPVRSYSGECVRTYAWREGFRFADCEPAPAPVVDAPAPKVVEVPALATEQALPPPVPVPQNVPFRVSMDAFFDFDQATLRPEGRAALEELARRLAVTQYDRLTIVGHADRIGPAAYNQKLSERRASAMRDYLVAQGVEAQKISASGVGESESIARCSGVHGRRLIACLQPDRSAQLTAVGRELHVSDASR